MGTISTRTDVMKLNLGCGPKKEEGFINIDMNPRWNPDMLLDLRKELPFENDSCEVVMAFHFLEHLDNDSLIQLIKEVYRVLIHDGIFDIIVPLGVTGEITHKIIFLENSFDRFYLQEDLSEFFDYPMKFSLLDKSVKYPEGERDPCLHIRLRVVK